MARGLAAIGKPEAAATLLRLTGDADPLVRAAALEAGAAIGRLPDEFAATAVAALADPAWQVRVGAARGLAASPEPDAVESALAAAAADPHLDVRKAAVQTLAAWADRPLPAQALRAATRDTDADVRAYARRALDAIGAGAA